jgi:cytochrome c peroxidase
MMHYLPITRGLALGALGLLLLSACATDPDPDVDPEPCAPTSLSLDEAIEYYGLEFRPSADELTVEGVALGRKLFYDPILSGDQTLSCAGCHKQEFAFSDGGVAFSVGIRGDLGTVNAPAIMNDAWASTFFWNGRAPTLEAQAEGPVPNPIEMDLPWSVAIERLEAHPEYPSLFQAAFCSPDITRDRVTSAIAQFERTLISLNSRYDQAFRGEAQLSEAEFNGLAVYRDELLGDCFHCHGGLGSIFDNSVFANGPQVFTNNGLDDSPDPGRFTVTGNPDDRGKFKVPTLRNIAVTGPYMHDGRFETLEEVVRFYNTGVRTASTNVDLKLRGNAEKRVSGELPVWTETQIQEIVAFLESLTDEEFLTDPAFSDPNTP